MRFKLLLLTFFGCLKAFGCTDLMLPFEFECKIQDRYQKLTLDFNSQRITMTDLKGFKIPRAVGIHSYFSFKNDFLNHSESSLKQNRKWLVWNNGQKFINNLSPVYLQMNDVLKLHKALFSSEISYATELGRLRTNNGEQIQNEFKMR